jgi:hypothetical protein
MPGVEGLGNAGILELGPQNDGCASLADAVGTHMVVPALMLPGISLPLLAPLASPLTNRPSRW